MIFFFFNNTGYIFLLFFKIFHSLAPIYSKLVTMRGCHFSLYIPAMQCVRICSTPQEKNLFGPKNKMKKIFDPLTQTFF